MDEICAVNHARRLDKLLSKKPRGRRAEKENDEDEDEETKDMVNILITRARAETKEEMRVDDRDAPFRTFLACGFISWARWEEICLSGSLPWRRAWSWARGEEGGEEERGEGGRFLPGQFSLAEDWSNCFY